MTAQLIDGQTGDHVWASRMDKQGDVVVLQEDVANAVYTSLAGLEGEIRKDEERRAWSKSAPSLDEYDYYSGAIGPFSLDRRRHRAGANDLQEGLRSSRTGASPDQDRGHLRQRYHERAQRRAARRRGARVEVARRGRAQPDLSRQETWLLHWLTAYTLRLHKGDFVGAAAEAEAAIKLVPYDSFSHGDLADVMWRPGVRSALPNWPNLPFSTIRVRHPGSTIQWLSLSIAPIGPRRPWHGLRRHPSHPILRLRSPMPALARWTRHVPPWHDPAEMARLHHHG